MATPSGSGPSPRKRSSALLSDGQQTSKSKRRQNSSSVSFSTHPPRQSSFAKHSGDFGANDPASPSVASAAVSGSVATSRAGRDKGRNVSDKVPKKRGRKPKNATASSLETSTQSQTSLPADNSAALAMSQRHAHGTANNVAGEEAEDDDEVHAGADMTVARNTEEEAKNERMLRSMLVKHLEPEQLMRYEKWRSAKLPDGPVKRVINATVSQSVSASIAVAMQAAAKSFIGTLVEMARDVQTEWMEAGSNEKSDMPEPIPPPGITPLTGGRRLPLRPDHLAEAYRRYKKYNVGQGIGMQGLWHQQNSSGAERFSSRARGKHLFR